MSVNGDSWALPLAYSVGGGSKWCPDFKRGPDRRGFDAIRLSEDVRTWQPQPERVSEGLYQPRLVPRLRIRVTVCRV